MPRHPHCARKTWSQSQERTFQKQTINKHRRHTNVKSVPGCALNRGDVMASEWVVNSDGLVRRGLAEQVPLKPRSEGRAGTCGRRSLSEPRIASFPGEVGRGGITARRIEGAGAVGVFGRDARPHQSAPVRRRRKRGRGPRRAESALGFSPGAGGCRRGL
ncbi:uncharacterized protein LOC101178172 [Nomascus leucogenys]|uniref:uncharacterized protein LOC101178172 n=1 Tax=Nomascus leucogenys TaxID=61853 RepID=UPI00122D8795|nr:uncharacterized protein LOC101178172 [Nomascus leucogenys]